MLHSYNGDLCLFSDHYLNKHTNLLQDIQALASGIPVSLQALCEIKNDVFQSLCEQKKNIEALRVFKENPAIFAARNGYKIVLNGSEYIESED